MTKPLLLVLLSLCCMPMGCGGVDSGDAEDTATGDALPRDCGNGRCGSTDSAGAPPSDLATSSPDLADSSPDMSTEPPDLSTAPPDMGPPPSAHNLYVATTGLDSNPGTEAAPFKTILKASQVAVPDTTVHVAAGTYAGGFQTAKSGTATARIRYLSDKKWGAKIVGSGSGYIWLNTGNYVTVDGFELTGSGNTHGLISGPWNGGDVGHHFIATNNFVHDMAVNTCGSGGAITVFSLTGHSVITNNIVRNVDVAQIGNCATQQGIYISEPDTYVANNIVSGVATAPIHQWHGATRSTIVNNTVFNSYWGILIGSGDGGQLPNGSQNNYVANNISVNNTGYGIIEFGKTSLNTYRNNLVYNNPSNKMNATGDVVSGTITADPKFVNYQANGSGDYHLMSTSPAIDTGTSMNAPSTDIDGAARPKGAGYDIGAYEH